mmetsp:Transcript_4684/g.13774  ORF Transcript_4684/g.13774 Transcript_4684/m.13774 type:complete len:390 (+) Transcript_4684:1715-2884(+)
MGRRAAKRGAAPLEALAFFAVRAVFFTVPLTTSIIQSAGFSFSGRGYPLPSKCAAMPATGPTYSVMPPVRRRMRSSKLVNTVQRGWWMTAAMVTPCLAKALSEDMSSRAEVESRPDVGSSRKRRAGSAASSMPTLTRFFWPPLMPRMRSSPTRVCCTWSRARSSTRRPTNTSTSLRFTLRGSLRCAANLRCSRTVRTGSITSCCGTKPTILLSLRAESTATPLSSIVPPDRSTLPERMLSSVVLPAPEAPMTAVMRPGLSSPVARWRMRSFFTLKVTRSNLMPIVGMSAWMLLITRSKLASITSRCLALSCTTWRITPTDISLGRCTRPLLPIALVRRPASAARFREATSLRRRRRISRAWYSRFAKYTPQPMPILMPNPPRSVAPCPT